MSLMYCGDGLDNCEQDNHIPAFKGFLFQEGPANAGDMKKPANISLQWLLWRWHMIKCDQEFISEETVEGLLGKGTLKMIIREDYGVLRLSPSFPFICLCMYVCM